MTTSTKRQHRRKSEPRAQRPKKKDRRLSAKTADRLDLYQRSVNSPDTDVDFLLETFETLRGRKPRHLREDFCGTANLTAEFLSRDEQNTAEGFDLDPVPVEWGKHRNFGRLGDGISRMTWHLADVRNPSDRSPDLTLAMNFSYWCFHERAELLEYFKGVHADLVEDGLFVLDLFGGPEALTEMEDIRDIDGAFEYVWDQKSWEPGSGKYKCAIHFRFKDGSEMTDAFVYDWRFWHLTELRDILIDAGFKTVNPYFEGTDPDDEEEGDGIFVVDQVGDNCEAWLGYLVAEK